MEKKDVIDLEGKRVKIVLHNQQYYRGRIMSVGDDYVRIIDLNSKTVFIVLKEIGILEVEA